MEFSPEEEKKAIAAQVEASIGSQLEDLIVATWLVYGLTCDEPSSQVHQIATGVINTFRLHEFGWSTSRMIPNRMFLEGENATLEDRISQYADEARKHLAELRPSLVMMLGFVFTRCREKPENLMNKWMRAAMERHCLSEDIFSGNPGRVNLVLSDSDKIQ